MKYLIIVYLSFLLINICHAQDGQYYFNKLHPYDGDTLALNGMSSLEVEEGYLLAGEFAQGEVQGFCVRKLSLYGEVEWLKTFPIEENVVTLNYGSVLLKTADNNFLLGGTAGETNYLKKFYLVKFTTEGEVLWIKSYAYDQHNGIPTIINTLDGGFLLSGFTQDTTPDVIPTKPYMLKLNSSGEVEWEQTHSQGITPFDAIQTTNGNYLLSGYQNNSPETSYDPWLLLTDSLGNQIWEKTYGTDEADAAAIIGQMSDNSIIICTAQGNNSPDIVTKAVIFNIDLEGNVNWSKEFSYEEYTLCSAGPIINDKKEITFVASYFHEFASIAPHRVRLMRLDSLGNILLDQPIDANIYGQQYIRDLDACEDGGYLLTGFIDNAQGGSWVVKTDSLGQTCYQVSCDSIAYATSISSLAVKDQSVMISPNPAQDQAIITYDLGDFKSAALHLYDTQGRLMQVQSLDVASSSTPINLNRLNSGLYVYELVVDGERVGGGSLLISP